MVVETLRLKAQTEDVLALLRERGPAGVTPLEAFTAVGSWRLGARVWELRAAGYDITTTIVGTVSGKHVARYVLREHDEQLALGVA